MRSGRKQPLENCIIAAANGCERIWSMLSFTAKDGEQHRCGSDGWTSTALRTSITCPRRPAHPRAVHIVTADFCLGGENMLVAKSGSYKGGKKCCLTENQ